MHCATTDFELARLKALRVNLPEIVDKHADHFPLFGRYWYPAWEYLSEEVKQAETDRCLLVLKDNDGLSNPYPQLPWWEPIFTLDALILLQKAGTIGC